MAEEFFKAYRKSFTKKAGIYGLKLNRPIYTGNVPIGTLGLELEMEGRNLINNGGALADVFADKTGARWLCKADGSLRNGGIEYVLSTPCTVEETPALVEGLFKKLKDVGSRIDNSNRCSTHVHVNVGPQKINILTSIIVLWAVFEEQLIKWHGINRTRNHFCLGFKDSSSTLNLWKSLLRNGQIPHEDGAKYSALNILTLWRFGSFEFRCGQEPNDPAKVTTWAKFLHYFVQYAINKYANPYQIAYDISEQGALLMLQNICKQDKGLEKFYEEIVGEQFEREFNEGCMDSFRIVQALCFEFPWHDWLPLINKEYIPDPFQTKRRGVF
jgi:Putative amidoligase enzyme